MFAFQSEDFDLSIESVLLAHKYRYVPHQYYHGYQKGRNIDGLVYCISGTATYDFGNTVVSLHPGQSIFLPRHAAYVVRCAGQEDFVHITVNFSLSPNDRSLFQQIDFSTNAAEMVADGIADTAGLLLLMLQCWEEKRQGYMLRVKALLYDFLYAYFIRLNNQSRNSDYYKIQPAKAYLDAHYTEEVSIGTLSALCGFSETHFRRLFHSVFHCSPSDYRLEKRLQRAKDLLLTEEFSVTEIAHAVGFDDANYFSRLFRSRLGISPTAYGRNTKNG